MLSMSKRVLLLPRVSKAALEGRWSPTKRPYTPLPHSKSCRAPSADVPHDDAWVVVIPADNDNVKPYAITIPAAPEDALQALRHIVGSDVVHVLTPERTQRGRDNGIGVVVSPIDKAGPINRLASTILTPLQYSAHLDDFENAVIVHGPKVRCRGTAVLIRVQTRPITEAEPAKEGEHQPVKESIVWRTSEPFVDFGLDDLENRWGLFQCIEGVSDGLAFCTAIPRSEENEKLLKKVTENTFAGRQEESGRMIRKMFPSDPVATALASSD